MIKSFITHSLHDVSSIRITQPKPLTSGGWTRDIVILLNDTKVTVTLFGDTVESLGYAEDLARAEAEEVAA